MGSRDRIYFAVHGPPVFRLSHMGDLVASYMWIFIERWVFSKGNRDRISFAVEAPPVFTLSHMATVVAIWDSVKTGGSWERQICKRNSKTFLKSFEFHRDSSLRLKLFAPYGTAERLGGRGSGISAKKIKKWCENCALIRSLKLKEIGFWSLLCDMGTHWAEILGGCQSRETEQLMPWSFLKFTNKKVVILKFWFVLSARARARALGQASQSWGAWPPARSKKTSKTSSSARARWNLALLKLLIFIEFRLQLRHPQSFSCPIWQILQPQICSFSLKHECFRELIVNEFILQFTTPLSFGCPIWEIL